MNIKRNRSAELVSNVFFLTVFTFFLTSLMTTLGSVIDGFIIGNTMGTKEIGACSLATINENPDPTAYIGIRMIMKLATDVSYTTTMKQNNLMIKVALQP